MKKLILLLLVLWGCIVSSVSASNITTKSASWGYQPVYQTYTERPMYQFRSTSTCASVIGNSAFTPTVENTSSSGGIDKKLRRDTNPFDLGPEIGVIDTPVGSPLVLLVLALLYLIYKRRNARTRRAVS